MDVVVFLGSVVNYADAQLLIDFARMNLRIAEAKAVRDDKTWVATVTDDTLTRSKGYRTIRAWWGRLSDRKREEQRRAMRMQIEGIRELERRATEAGEEFSLADVKISIDITEDKRVRCTCGRQRSTKDDLARWEEERKDAGAAPLAFNPQWAKDLCWTADGHRCRMIPLVRCTGTGAGITEPIDEHITCEKCTRTWHQNDIGFRIPEHEAT